MGTGKALIDEINTHALRSGTVATWWLGQAGFAFKTTAGVIYIDAFLSNLPDRLVPPPLGLQDITNANWIAGTHDHPDHIDRGAWPELAKASPQAKFIVPEILLDGLAEDLRIAPSRFIGMDDGKSVQLAPDLKLTALASAHEELAPDPATGKFATLGFVVQAGKCTFYHSGDTCIYEGLLTRLRAWKLDAMFLPINGRDARRLAAGWIGNMTYQEAADLAGAAKAALVVPAHYDMFAFNPGPVSDFIDYVHVKYPRLNVLAPAVGECFVFGPGQ